MTVISQPSVILQQALIGATDAHPHSHIIKSPQVGGQLTGQLSAQLSGQPHQPSFQSQVFIQAPHTNQTHHHGQHQPLQQQFEVKADEVQSQPQQHVLQRPTQGTSP